MRVSFRSARTRRRPCSERRRLISHVTALAAWEGEVAAGEAAEAPQRASAVADAGQDTRTKTVL